MQPAIRPEAEIQHAGKRAARYAIGLAVLAILSLGFALWAAAQPWFLYDFAPPSLRTLGYGIRASGKNCDVVLYGDSTALVGLDPSVIRNKTGLTVCNVAESKVVLDFVGVDYPLDEYLAHNLAPKFLVTAWAPGDFDLERARTYEYSPDGYLYAFQFRRDAWLWRGLIYHPKNALSFLVWVQGSMLQRLLHRFILREPEFDGARARDAANGVWEPGAPAQEACEDFPLQPFVSRDENRVSVDKFRERYAGRTEHLIIDVTPVADCFVKGRESLATVRGLSDNAPQLWPVNSFSTMNVHLTTQSARRFSAQIADQINSIVQQDPKPQGPAQAPDRLPTR